MVTRVLFRVLFLLAFIESHSQDYGNWQCNLYEYPTKLLVKKRGRCFKTFSLWKIPEKNLKVDFIACKKNRDSVNVTMVVRDGQRYYYLPEEAFPYMNDEYEPILKTFDIFFVEAKNNNRFKIIEVFRDVGKVNEFVNFSFKYGGVLRLVFYVKGMLPVYLEYIPQAGTSE